MVTVECMFCHRRFVWLSKPCESVVLLYSGLYRAVNLSDVHLARLTFYAVYPRSPQPQVVLYRLKEIGDPPRHQANTFMCLASIVLSRLYVVWTYGRRAIEVGFSFSLDFVNAGWMARRTCFRPYPYSNS